VETTNALARDLQPGATTVDATAMAAMAAMEGAAMMTGKAIHAVEHHPQALAVTVARRAETMRGVQEDL
jgi:hypothetical protein